MKRRFDDIITDVRRGFTDNFVQRVEDYNKRTTKWNFWDYIKKTIEGAMKEGLTPDLTWRQAFELALIYIDQKEKRDT